MSIFGQAINFKEVTSNAIWKTYIPIIGPTPVTGNTVSVSNAVGRYSLFANKIIFINIRFRLTAFTGTPTGFTVQGPQGYSPKDDQASSLDGTFLTHMLMGINNTSGKLLYGYIGGASQPAGPPNANGLQNFAFPMVNYDGSNPLVVNNVYTIWGQYVTNLA